MGFRLASDPAVLANLGVIGLLAATHALVAVVLCIAAVVLLYGRDRQVSTETSGVQTGSIAAAWLGKLKGPLIMAATVAAGCVVALYLPGRDAVPVADIGDVALRTMLVAVGYSMGCSRMPGLAMLKDWRLVLLPALTIVISLGAGLVSALLWSRHPAEGAAVAAGFGWYSLSAVLIADTGNQALAATAFLSNLFREGFAILSIGFLQAAGRPLAGISAAGATSMDVSLPVISLYQNGRHAPLSVYHGFVVSLAVPVAVPLSLSFFN